jgi:hypothetical protein
MKRKPISQRFQRIYFARKLAENKPFMLGFWLANNYSRLRFLVVLTH